MAAAVRELRTLQITAVVSDAVIARVVLHLTGRGAVVRELCCSVDPVGLVRMRAVVETAAGRGARLAATLNRVVEVIDVELEEERCALLSTS